MSQRESVRIRSSSVFRFGLIGYACADLLVQVAAVDLDVARLVHHLGGAVELGLDPRHRVDDLRGREQRALLAVQELRQAASAMLPRGAACAISAGVSFSQMCVP